jgi:hypothetical protein
MRDRVGGFGRERLLGDERHRRVAHPLGELGGVPTCLSRDALPR